MKSPGEYFLEVSTSTPQSGAKSTHEVDRATFQMTCKTLQHGTGFGGMNRSWRKFGAWHCVSGSEDRLEEANGECEASASVKTLAYQRWQDHEDQRGAAADVEWSWPEPTRQTVCAADRKSWRNGDARAFCSQKVMSEFQMLDIQLQVLLDIGFCFDL